jgi:pimeloyl-ACP methyl ester carboxylesterase
MQALHVLSRQINLPGGALNLREIDGSGPPLLLIHGFTDCAESYAMIAPHLGDRRLLIPDMRGHGLSFRADDMSLDALVGDMRAVLAALEIDRIGVIGHSMGALVALQLASMEPEKVSRLALISGSLQPQGRSFAALSAEIAALPTPLCVDHPFFQSWHHCERPVPSDFLNWLAASAAQMRRRDWLACLQTLESANLIREAERLRTPTLVLSGDKDPIFDTSHQASLAASLPKASHRRYAGLGHNLHWEAPIEVAKELSAFFQI